MDVHQIVSAGQMACILEATCPKPGNVSRYRDFGDTTFEHFLAGSIGIGEALRLAAERGVEVGQGKRSSSDLALGALMRKAVEDSRSLHKGGNTNLGTIILLVPLAAAAGVSTGASKDINNEALRESIERIISESTFSDTVELFQAIRFANPGGLGKVERYDVTSSSSKGEVEAEDVNLHRIFDLSKDDSISTEMVTKMAITFEVGYPALSKAYESGESICNSVLRTFFEIISKYPDSLIVRKNGVEAGKEISKEASSILNEGLPEERITTFDENLRSQGNRLNPGTTADLVASSLNVAILNGLKVR